MTVQMCIVIDVLFFFFQAEDGIRDKLVTGVQTCALPIFEVVPVFDEAQLGTAGECLLELRAVAGDRQARVVWREHEADDRSEERRVGKSVDLGGRRIIKKKKRR